MNKIDPIITLAKSIQLALQGIYIEHIVFSIDKKTNVIRFFSKVSNKEVLKVEHNKYVPIKINTRRG